MCVHVYACWSALLACKGEDGGCGCVSMYVCMSVFSCVCVVCMCNYVYVNVYVNVLCIHNTLFT